MICYDILENWKHCIYHMLIALDLSVCSLWQTNYSNHCKPSTSATTTTTSPRYCSFQCRYHHVMFSQASLQHESRCLMEAEGLQREDCPVGSPPTVPQSHPISLLALSQNSSVTLPCSQESYYPYYSVRPPVTLPSLFPCYIRPDNPSSWEAIIWKFSSMVDISVLWIAMSF